MSRWLLGSIGLTVFSWLGWLAILSRGDFFPDKVPIHWNLEMEVDGWASGEIAIWWLASMPAAMTLLLAINWLLPRFSPAAFQDATTRSKFDYTLFVTIGFLTIMTGMLVVAMRTGDFPVRWIIAAFFVFFGLLGWAMRGLKRNEWIGVRTPWTLKNDAVWDRTHDFAAKLWLALGAVGLIAVAVGTPPIVCVGFLLPAVLAPVIASYAFARSLRGSA